MGNRKEWGMRNWEMEKNGEVGIEKNWECGVSES
jgi:hypothetical protein